MTDKLTDLMHAIDEAWNARQWDKYMSLIAPDFRGYMNGDIEPHGRDEHLRRGKAFCEEYPDNRIDNNPYLVLFEDGARSRTCSIAVTTGSHRSGKPLRATLAVICTWRNGQITEQREFIATDPFPAN
jgi:ketosteroid isomerase-like protein